MPEIKIFYYRYWRQILRAMVRQRWALIEKDGNYTVRGGIVNKEQFEKMRKYLYDSKSARRHIAWRPSKEGKAYIRFGSGRWRSV